MAFLRVHPSTSRRSEAASRKGNLNDLPDTPVRWRVGSSAKLKSIVMDPQPTDARRALTTVRRVTYLFELRMKCIIVTDYGSSMARRAVRREGESRNCDSTVCPTTVFTFFQSAKP
jgi:hypothetical protein